MQKAAEAPDTSVDTQFVVLLASPRSGTHLLRRILVSDPNIHDAGECFYPKDLERPVRAFSFWKFLCDHRELTKSLPVTVKQRETQWRAYLQFLGRKGPNKLTILDFKYDQLRTADVGLLWPEDVPTMLKLAMRDQIPVIHLKRRNHLEILCSLQLASQTDEWVRQERKPPSFKMAKAAAKIKIDSSKLLDKLAAMKSREDLVDSWIGAYPAQIELKYEDLLEDGHLSSKAAQSIEQLVGRKIRISPQPRTLKISPPLDRLVENYGEIKAALSKTSYAEFLSHKHSCVPTLQLAEREPAKWPAMHQNWFVTKVLLPRPLITFTAISADMRNFDTLLTGAPAVFDVPRALHLLHLTSTLETGGARQLAAALATIQKLLPGHTLLPLTGTEYEGALLTQHGIPSILASGLIFVDETIWRPRAGEISGLPMFDAIYVARLALSKRHELAQGIDRLLLAYGYSPPDTHERVRGILPKAFFANHELGDGGSLSHESISRLFGHSRVGLCLSPVEGCMRVSIEYLLSGLPVVSTPSIGGRERYYVAPYCRVVEATADAVACAVRDLATRNLDRRKIRNHVAQLIGFDRHNFLLNINKIAKLHLGKDRLIPSMAPMIGALAKFLPPSQVIAKVRNEFAGLPQA